MPKSQPSTRLIIMMIKQQRNHSMLSRPVELLACLTTSLKVRPWRQAPLLHDASAWHRAVLHAFLPSRHHVLTDLMRGCHMFHAGTGAEGARGQHDRELVVCTGRGSSGGLASHLVDAPQQKSAAVAVPLPRVAFAADPLPVVRL